MPPEPNQFVASDQHVGNAIHDAAGQAYWDRLWRGKPAPAAADPRAPGLSQLFVRRLHSFFESVLHARSGQTLLELGCGSSVWLPYFGREFGLTVTGIDYSDVGCETARAIMSSAGVTGHVIQSDFFHPPVGLRESFDVVYSAGVVEHFQPTHTCLEQFATFLKPGGLMITTIPNMTGILGWMQKVLSREIYDIHVPLTREALSSAHREAGLEVSSCAYFLSSGFGVISVEHQGEPVPALTLKRALVRFLGKVSAAIWLIEDRIGKLPNTRVFSPYIVCVARKPAKVNAN